MATYYLLVKYNVNGGQISDNPHYNSGSIHSYTSYSDSGTVVHYFKAASTTSNVTSCATSTGTYTTHQSRYSATATDKVCDLTNVESLGITRTGYHLRENMEYITTDSSKNILSQNADSTTHKAYISRLGGSTTANKTVTINVNWYANTYTISYNANSGSGAPSSQTATYDSTLTLSSTIPTRSGYKFLGWSANSSATTAGYSAGQTLSAFQVNSLVSGLSDGGTKTLYAVWGQDTQKPSKPTITVGGMGQLQGRIIIGLTFASTDDVGVTGYYWGTSSSTSVTFTSVTSATNWSFSYPHWGEGTYYLRVKDAAGNISDYASMTFYKTDFSVTNGTLQSNYSYGVTTPGGYTFTLPTVTPNSNYTSPGYWSYNGTNVGAEGASYTAPYASRTLTIKCFYDGTYTLTIHYHLNGGTIASRVYPTTSGASNYYRFGTNSQIYSCTRTGGDSTLYETTIQCKTSQSQSTAITNLLKVSDYNATRSFTSNDDSSTSGTTYTWTPRSNAQYITEGGQQINQNTTSSSSTNAATVYRLLDEENITQNTTVILYINWNCGNYHSLDVQYQINGGNQSSDPAQSGSNYYSTFSSGLITDCSSSGNQQVVHRSHMECIPSNSSTTYMNLLNYTTYNAVRSGYSVPSTAEYVTDNGTVINQDLDTTPSATTNVASIYRLLDNNNLTENTLITISINWTSNTATIYVKTTDGWKKGIVYIKTDQGWKQGTPYIKTTNGWKQGT